MAAAADSASLTARVYPSRELVRARLAPGLVRTALAAVQAPPEKSTATSRRSGIDDASRNSAGPDTSTSSRSSPSTRVELSARARQQVARLQRLDSEVRAHEAAHRAAGGSLTSAASYSYTTGPDGKRYAIGGEVSIDTSRTGSPELDITRAAVIRRAALAPASPSGQDLAVAAAASRMEQAARQELAAQQRAEQRRQQLEGSSSGDWLSRAYRPEPAVRGFLLDTRV